MTIKHDNEKAAEEYYQNMSLDRIVMLHASFHSNNLRVLKEEIKKTFLAGCAQERERIWAAIQAEVAYYGPGFMESIGVEHLKGIIFKEGKE